MTRPFYVPAEREDEVFRAAYDAGLPILLKGPTGCGKTRFVEAMAHAVGRPLISVACHDDLSAADLLGRFLLEGSSTVWQDGPLTRAVREGAICYLDEVVEARSDTLTVIHGLTDHRRALTIERTGEELSAAPGFGLVVSYNPGYQSVLKQLKPSLRQRMVAIGLNYLPNETETSVVATETGLPREPAERLVAVATAIRRQHQLGLAEVAGTRTLVAAAHLMMAGVETRIALKHSIVEVLSDDDEAVEALMQIVDTFFVPEPVG
ncbi:CbbQ/NirQ/NorQ/GpvN family protein [Mycobacterium sp. GA-2829]|uniref:CbbQ/NirQ/NorQ/GpvN family protein n=1 Tax=Mycobacterium sp. GA-2829 TaxID=1772283 RepID=UPI000A3FECB5|nr:CbbQ/NirQ/NorQ/GpvN family protein [Mycobacterium sp. GA-2829]